MVLIPVFENTKQFHLTITMSPVSDKKIYLIWWFWWQWYLTRQNIIFIRWFGGHQYLTRQNIRNWFSYVLFSSWYVLHKWGNTFSFKYCIL